MIATLLLVATLVVLGVVVPRGQTVDRADRESLRVHAAFVREMRR